MRKLLLALALLLSPCSAFAQCTGVFAPNTLCGNLGGQPAPPAMFSATLSIFGPGVTTSGQIPTFGNNTGNQLADPATITTSQAFNFTGQTSQSSAAISSAAITGSQTTSAGIATLNITSSFLYKGVPYVFQTPITSLNAGLGITISGITTPTINQAYNTASFQGTVANPTGTTSTAGAMMGLGSTCKITPVNSGRLHVNLFTNTSNTSAVANSLFLKFGSGTPPANGSITSGTTVGGPLNTFISSANTNADVPLGGVVTGLTSGTLYWFDVELVSPSVTTTATILNINCFGMEF